MPERSGVDTRTTLGYIERLWRYPVKSLGAESLASAHVGFEGIDGDRRRALIVATPAHPRYAKPYRGKEDNLLHTVASISEGSVIAGRRGITVEAADDGPFFDDAPVSIVINTWLLQAERLAGRPLEARRFRPNLFVRAIPSFDLREQDIVGVVLECGSVRLRVTSTIKRCVTITYDVDTGTPTPSILRELTRDRETVLGVYADVATRGTINLGDALARAG